MLRFTIEEAKSRKDGPRQQANRLLVYGCEIDDIAFIDMVERCGANVVIDDLCIGTKIYREDVAVDGDPLRNLADYYLTRIMCPRTVRRCVGTRQDDLESRFGYLGDLVREFNVNGAILYIISYCDTFEYDVLDVRDYLEGMGVRCLHLEDDYSLTSIQGLKTRVEAFLEMLQ
jgi:benzoyl-CoA reductase subunit C